jgi:uncharacterized protein (TIGR02145 family)
MKINNLNSMKTIDIGNQTWMANNLNTITFQNRELIPIAKTKKDWKNYALTKTPAIFLSDEFQDEVLYNYAALIDNRGLLPKEFSIPTIQEVKILLDCLGDYSALKLKSNKEAEWPEIAFLEQEERERKIKFGNASGWNAKPTGMVRHDGEYVCGFRANYWVFENENNKPCILQLIEGVETEVVMNEADFKKIGIKILECGFSVRGIKNN